MLQQPQPALPRACQPAGKESLTASAGYWIFCSERPGPGADRGGAQGGLRAWPPEAGVICAWRRGPGGHGHYSPPANSCCCVRPDLTCKPLLLFPFSLSFPSTRFFLLPLSYVLLFPFQLILSLSFLSFALSSTSLFLFASSSLLPQGPALLPDYQETHGPVDHPEEAAKEGPSSLHHPRGGGIRRPPHVLELC